LPLPVMAPEIRSQAFVHTFSVGVYEEREIHLPDGHSSREVHGPDEQ
jgi:hypothetical protein